MSRRLGLEPYNYLPITNHNVHFNSLTSGFIDNASKDLSVVLFLPFHDAILRANFDMKFKVLPPFSNLFICYVVVAAQACYRCCSRNVSSFRGGGGRGGRHEIIDWNNDNLRVWLFVALTTGHVIT